MNHGGGLVILPAGSIDGGRISTRGVTVRRKSVSNFVPYFVRIPNNSIKLIFFWKLSVLALWLTSGYSLPKGRAPYNLMMISLRTGLSWNHHQVHRKLKLGCDLETLDLARAKTHDLGSPCHPPYQHPQRYFSQSHNHV